MISQNLLTELKEIIKDEYGHDLDMREISQVGNDLIGYFDLLAKIYRQQHEDKYIQGNRERVEKISPKI